jgi:hypothetical protein
MPIGLLNLSKGLGLKLYASVFFTFYFLLFTFLQYRVILFNLFHNRFGYTRK